MFGKSGLVAMAAAAALSASLWTPPRLERRERSYRRVLPHGYLRPRKGRTGGGFKGSSAAKRGARIAAKRAKDGRRARRSEKLLAARYGTTRAGARQAINGGRS